MKINFLFGRKSEFPKPSSIPEGYEVAGQTGFYYPLMFFMLFIPLCILVTIGIFSFIGYDRLFIRMARWIYNYNFLFNAIMPFTILTIIYSLMWAITGDAMIFLPLIAYNLITSSQDIHTFFYSLVKIPNGTYFYGYEEFLRKV